MNDPLHVAGPAVWLDPPMDLRDYIGARLYDGWVSSSDWAERYRAHTRWAQFCGLCGQPFEPRTEMVFVPGTIIAVADNVEGWWHPDPPTFWELSTLPERLCTPEAILVDPKPTSEHLADIMRPDPQLLREFGRAYPVLRDLDPEVRSSIFRETE